MIAARNTPTAILVNRAELAAQWRQRLAEFLTITEREIGQLGAGRRKRHGRVDVMMLPTLARRDDVQELLSGYGQVIVDECHNVAAPAVNAALRDVSVRTWVGLTATPFRADRLDGLITMQCGPIRHTMPPATTGGRRVVVHETDFTIDDPSAPIQDIYSQLTADTTRNTMIVTAVAAAAGRGRRCLVLTNRRAHLDTLTRELRTATDADVITLHGGLSKTERASVTRQLSSLATEDHAFVLVAIDKVAGEGLDVSSLDTVFLTVPVSFKGRIIQQVGRATRGAPDDDHPAVVHDFHDAHVPVLDRMFQRRHRVIAREGFVVADLNGETLTDLLLAARRV